MTLQLQFTGGAPEPAPDTVTVEGGEVRAVSPEGELRSLKLVELLERIAPPRLDTCGSILPDGVKSVIPIPRGSIVVHQTAPRVHRFAWIAPDSPAPFGAGASYREVRIALPYLVVLAVFDGGPGAQPRLAGTSECFFANRPLDVDGLDTQLHFPALLNCSRFPDDPARPLSWICVQHQPPVAHPSGEAPGVALRRELTALLRHLLESGFNLSSEHHELSSWYSETVKAAIDPRVASVEAWEQATAEDPLFVLDVPWLPTQRTLRAVAQRIADAREPGGARFETARDLMRAIFQKRPRTRTRR